MPQTNCRSPFPLAVVGSFAAVLWFGGVYDDRHLDPRRSETTTARLGGFVLATEVKGDSENDGFVRRFDHGKGGVQAVMPGRHRHAHGTTVDEIVVSKPMQPYGYAFPKVKKGGWRYLDREIRRMIDASLGSSKRPAWEEIVLHGSSSHTGNSAVLESRHRQLGLDASAYHFVISNGADAPAGAVGVSRRWMEQRPSPSVRVGKGADISICLIGDFHEERMREEQLEALDELVRYLRAKLGVVPVKSHRRVESDAASCPGRYLPESVTDGLNGLGGEVEGR